MKIRSHCLLFVSWSLCLVTLDPVPMLGIVAAGGLYLATDAYPCELVTSSSGQVAFE
jgi:hypothetical protein